LETFIWVLVIILSIAIVIITLLTSVSSFHKKFVEKYWKKKVGE